MPGLERAVGRITKWVGWDIEDRKSPLRVCLDATDGKSTSVELKLMGNSCNIYLASASTLWVGLDSITQVMAIRPGMGRSVDAAPDMLPSNLVGKNLD